MLKRFTPGGVSALLLGLAWLVFCLPLLADQQPYYRDILRTDWPMRELIGASLRSGHLPQWYPYEGLGLGFMGNAEGLFRPLTALAVEELCEAMFRNGLPQSPPALRSRR